MAPSVAAVSAPHPVSASLMMPGRLAPPGQQQITNATAPIISANAPNPTPRTTPNAVVTSLLAGGWRLASVTVLALGAPSEKVNAPCTGCESADITCQATV